MSGPNTMSITEPPGLSDTHLPRGVTLFGLAPDRLRIWGLKSALSLIDQAITSGAGFAVNLLLARWLPPISYGAFAVAFAALLFAAGFHNVLVLEPLSVFGPARHSANLPAYFRAQVFIHFALVGAISGVGLLAAIFLWVVAPQNPVTSAVAASAIALPFFLLLWLARRMCYVVQRPSLAVSGSAAYLATIVFGLFVLRYIGCVSPVSTFLLIGAMSLFSSVILLSPLVLGKGSGLRPVILSVRTVLKENWLYGRWLVGGAVLFAVSTQTQTFLAAGLLGLSAAGILRAMQIPSLVMVQVTTAAGLLVLPSFSCEFGRGRTEQLRRKATIVSLSLGLSALCFAAILALLAGRTEHLLFGGKYVEYAWLMPVLAVAPVWTGFSMGCSMALRASQKPHFDLIANMAAAPVAVVSAFFLTRWWGLAGAVASIALSFSVLGGVTILFFLRSARDPTSVTIAQNG